MKKIVLETKDLTKTYGTREARKVVDLVDITAYEGEIFGFLGPNGAGKTTTLGMGLGYTQILEFLPAARLYRRQDVGG